MLIIAGVALLAGAIGLQFTPERKPFRPASTMPEGLARELPGSVEGWQGMDQPLGPTEASSAAAADLLRYDDYVFRRYSRGGREFSVYIAYWKPGKMPTRLVAEHTPDRCWIENGWLCHERASLQQREVGGRPLPPAEWRKFTAPRPEGVVQHVLFWLMVDGKPYDYSRHANVIEHSIAWWKGSVAEFVGDGHATKLFVRISSTEPFEQIWNDPGFRETLIKVVDLSLWHGREN